MKASDLLVKALEREGVEYIFGIPGEENLDLLESLRESSIRLIVTRHEQAAGFMAATYGRLTGKAGVCLSTLGPGATNLVTAAAYANLGAMPMVMLTGQKPMKSSKQGRFQIVDVVDMMQPITKYTKQIESGDLVPSTVREAFRRAREERPGAAHLELAEDIAREETEEPVVEASYVRRPIAEHEAIRRAVDLISQARHPLLLIGVGEAKFSPGIHPATGGDNTLVADLELHGVGKACDEVGAIGLRRFQCGKIAGKAIGPIDVIGGMLKIRATLVGHTLLQSRVVITDHD